MTTIYRVAVLYLLVHLHHDLTGTALLGSLFVDYWVAGLLSLEWRNERRTE